jgi:hypothetical protein
MPSFARAESRPAWLPAVALSAALAAILVVWDPHVRDLAAQTFRAELFDHVGFAIWNGSWYQGHYTLTYSVLFPPLAALLGPMLVGGLSVVASTYLFDRIVREQWGERARPAALWFAVGAVAMIANGNLTYSLGVAFGLASLRCLQERRPRIAIAGAIACGLSSPVAAAFFAGIAAVGAAGRRGRLDRTALAVGIAAIAPVLLLNVVFPGTGVQPFSFASYIAAPLWCIGGPLYLTREMPEERPFRITVIAFVVAVTLVWLVPSALGDNVLRPLWLFGGPVLLAILLAHRPAVPRRGIAVLVAAIALLLAGYWQVSYAAKELIQSAGDPSTQAAYYKPLKSWLRAHGGASARIEVPPTLNSWESAYLAPDFQLARGWLRQLDATRGSIFFRDRLTARRYHDWLRDNGVRYVALADAPPQKYAVTEHALVARDPGYLKPVWSSRHWRVFAVRHHAPLVQSEDGRARVTALRPESLSLDVTRPGTFTVLVRSSPYWAMHRGQGCVGEQGRWTKLRVAKPGRVKIGIDFSLGRGIESASGSTPHC